MADRITTLRQTRAAAIDELNTEAVIADGEKYAAVETRIADLDAQIERAVKAEERMAGLAKPVGAGVADSEMPAPELMRIATGNAAWSRPAGQTRTFEDCLREARAVNSYGIQNNGSFRSFGEQLQSIYNYYASRGSNTDGRLVRAPQGGSEVDPTGGGFLVQADFADAIFMLAHDIGDILGRVRKLPIGPNSNGIKIPGIDETSRATGSRWGGVQSYWAAEGAGVTATKPKFRLTEFDLKKLMSVAYITDELLQDSTALTSVYGQAFSEEVTFMTEDAIFEGTGAGQPLGILNSPALVTVAKENGQVAGTVVKENIDKAWARLWARSRKNAVWLINQDVEPQLAALNGIVGTGGQLVYMPPGGLSAAPFATLYGRPVIANEYSSALGAPGDILLADLSQYYVADKSGVQVATSMHIAFLTDEMAFRITYRVDGKPIWHQAITPFKGNLTKSPFVALAQR